MSKKVQARNSVWYEIAAALKEFARIKPRTAAFAFRVRRLMRAIVPLGEDIEEQRQELIEIHRAIGSDGIPLRSEGGVPLTDAIAFGRELRELMSEVVTLEVEPIRAEELEKEGIILTPDLAYRLGPILLEPANTSDGVQEIALVEVPN